MTDFELGSLAFEPGDFYDEMDSSGFKAGKACADAANAILRSKLESAPEIWLVDDKLKTAHRAHPVDATSVGRLVCIKKLESKE